MLTKSCIVSILYKESDSFRPAGETDPGRSGERESGRPGEPPADLPARCTSTIMPHFPPNVQAPSCPVFRPVYRFHPVPFPAMHFKCRSSPPRPSVLPRWHPPGISFPLSDPLPGRREPALYLCFPCRCCLR